MNLPKISKATALVIIGVIVTCCVIGVVIAQHLASVDVPLNGTILTPAELIATPDSIDVGLIVQGDTTPINKTVILENIGENSTTPLHMSCDLDPAVGVVTWDFGIGQVLAAGDFKSVTFTFTPKTDAPIGPFNCIITITES